MAYALVIDDDLGNLGVMEQLFILHNVRYTSIQDVTQVEKILPHLDKLDAIFVDLEMPEINGYEVLEWLKTQPRMAGVPIIACTVHSAEIHTAQELGFHSFICKPIDVDRFPHQLASILQNVPVWEVR